MNCSGAKEMCKGLYDPVIIVIDVTSSTRRALAFASVHNIALISTQGSPAIYGMDGTSKELTDVGIIMSKSI